MNKILFFILLVGINSQAFATDVATMEEFTNALNNGENIVLTDDLTAPSNYSTTYPKKSDYSIDGNNHTIYGGDQTTQFIRNMGGSINEIKNITFDGFVNQVIPKDEDGNVLDPDDNMGAVITNQGRIEKIDGTFKNNQAYHGAAIFNGSNKYIGSINGTFTGNKSETYSDKVYTEASGAAIHNQGHIGNITGTFENNTAQMAGTIWNYGTIDNITATFKNNHRSAVGGNHGTVTITNSLFYQNDTTGRLYYWTDEDGNLKSTNHGQSGAGLVWWGGQTFNVYNTTFEENRADWKGGAIGGWNGGALKLVDSFLTNNSSGEEGGGIYQTGNGTGEITNTVFTQNKGRTGGAIYSTAKYTIKDSTFQKNQDTVNWSTGGGAIANGGTMTIDNSLITENKSHSAGGGISNFGGTLVYNNNKITSNHAQSYGGGVYTSGGKVTINNSTIEANTSANGAAGASRSGEIEINNSTITNNQSSNKGGAFYVGEIIKDEVSTTGTLTINDSTITNNTSSASGGAVHVAKGNLTITNSTITGNESASGGAIHSHADITLKADNGTLKIADNNTKTNNTGIFMENQNTTINLDTKNNGLIEIKDIVDGNNYNLNITGDTLDYSLLTKENIDQIAHVDFQNSVNNLNTLSLNEGGVLSLELTETMNTTNLTGNNGAILLKAEMDSTTNTLTNGLINVSNDVSGHSNVILDFLKDDTSSAPTDVFSPFVNAPNDDKTTSATFNVAAVMGSPYAWVSKYNIKGDETGSVWYLAIQTEEEPVDPVPPVEPDEPVTPEEPDEPVTPEEPDNPNLLPLDPNFPTLHPSARPIYRAEVPTYIGVTRTAIEQNRSIADSIKDGLSFKKNGNCKKGFCRTRRVLPQKTAWIDVSYEKSKIKAPSEIDAKIKGTTLGIDIYHDYKQRAGIFGAYRNGEYDFSGKGDLLAKVGSDIKTDSILGGGYYRYDNNNWVVLATIFGGKQDLDITTDDTLIDTSTDAKQYGASLELAKRLAISRHLDIEPSLGLYYTYLDFDKISDKLGKEIYFDTTQYLEAELGLKVEYLCCRNGCTNRYYVKPSIIKTFAHGAKTKITGLNPIKSYEDEVLGRIELGTTFGITNNLSGYATGGYTFGSDYKSYDLNAGLNYKF
ncbi:MAG: autotransporter domain-containing protein [Alphaproteobacteria bacterium]|nr:autotransporter domain-containing protein [Alphaproteobacteria bacterium]